MPDLGRIPRRARLLALASLCVTALLGLSCSETHEPLDWRDAVRSGLGESHALVADTLVDWTAQGTAVVANGSTGRLLIGRVTREDQTIEARAFVRWDLSELPEGTVSAAHVEVHLAGIDAADPTGADDHVLHMHRVVEAWTEDSLGLIPPPAAYMGSWAEGSLSSDGLGYEDTLLFKGDLFGDQELQTWIADWRTADSTNFGVMLRATSGSAEGILRLYSSEGVDYESGASLLTPLLVVTVDGTAVSIEADADAYYVDCSPVVAPPDSLLLVSSGYVQRAALHLTLPASLPEATASDPPAIAIVRGLLRLHVVPGAAWSLPSERTLVVRAYESQIDPSAADPLADITFDDLIAESSVAGDDSVLVLGIAEHLQSRLEGSTKSLVLVCRTETGRLSSLLLQGVNGVGGRPEVELQWVTLGERLGQ